MIELLNKKTLISLHKLPEVAKELINIMKVGSIVLLHGDMGAGKTTLVREIAKHYGYQRVSSPTFSLVNKYEGNIEIFHLDLYRLNSISDLHSIDIDAYFDKENSIVFIEWAE